MSALESTASAGDYARRFCEKRVPEYSRWQKMNTKTDYLIG
jgi:hypothetical protein